MNNVPDLSALRQNCPENYWFFPIRMESKTKIEWKPNIVECFGAFKKPVDEIAWNNLLRRGSIAAATEEEQDKLRRWWREGWQHIPQLPHAPSKSIPIMRIRNTMNGQDLDLVYPNLATAAKGENMGMEDIEVLNMEVRTKLSSPYKYILMRQHANARVLARKDEQYPWTLFAADNRILGQYYNKRQLAADIGVHWRIIDLAHERSWNRLNDGRWVWYERWGIMPITPDDEPLGMDWRIKYDAANFEEGNFDPT